MAVQQVNIICLILIGAYVYAAPATQQSSNPEKPLPPITINLEKPSQQKAIATPGTQKPQAGGQYRSTSEVDAKYDTVLQGSRDKLNALSNSSANTSEAKVASIAGGIVIERMEKLKPYIMAWRAAADKVHKAQGLTPDFKSSQDVSERINMYQSLMDSNEKAAEFIVKNFSTLEADLRKAGVPEADLKPIVANVLLELNVFMQRVKVTERMCENAIQALKSLRSEWGNWQFTPATGLQFGVGFTSENKAAYNKAVQQYKVEIETLQKTGAFE
jgi:hypothetical protein